MKLSSAQELRRIAEKNIHAREDHVVKEWISVCENRATIGIFEYRVYLSAMDRNHLDEGYISKIMKDLGYTLTQVEEHYLLISW